MMNLLDKPVPGGDINEEIYSLLAELGVPEHILGHRYLVEALKITVLDPSIIYAITGELHPQVATTAGTTASRTERAIRHAIELCWDRGDLDVLKKHFGNTVSSSKGKPTNSEFIARCATIIRQRVNGGE